MKNQALLLVLSMGFLGNLFSGLVSPAMGGDANSARSTAGAIKSGAIIYSLNLADPKVRKSLEAQGATIANDGPANEPCVHIDAVETPGKVGKLIVIPVDIVSLRGARVGLNAYMCAENIRSQSKDVPIGPWAGVKCQLQYDSANDGYKGVVSQDEGQCHQSFVWKESGVICGVSGDATNGRIRIGVERALGTVRLTNIRFVVLQPKVERTIPQNSPALHAVTSHRGFMSPMKFRAQDFADLAAWNVNLVRWQLCGNRKETYENYEKWLPGKLDELELALNAAYQNGIKLVVDLHSLPGERLLPDKTLRMVMEKGSQDRFIEIWEGIARRFKDHPGLYAYDLVNEPVQNHPSPPGIEDWLGIQAKAAKAVRAIDPKTPIVIEMDRWDQPDVYQWLEKPIDVPNVIYEAHVYWPGEFTGQGVLTDQGIAADKAVEARSVVYPGVIGGSEVNKEALRKYVEPLRQFQLAYNVPVYIGEVGVVRWAPGAARWLDDYISIFEEYGWDWTCHAFREWGGWSCEAADLPFDRNNHPLATTPPERQLVLRKWFAKNVPFPKPENGDRPSPQETDKPVVNGHPI